MDTHLALGIAGVIAPIVLAIFRVPLAYSLGTVGFLGLTYMQGFSNALWTLGQIPFSVGTNWTLLAIPLFLLMAYLATEAKIAANLYEFAHKTLGSFKGGLAMGTIIAGSLFGAVSGSTLAAAAALSTFASPEMKKYKYGDALAGGTVAGAATLSSIIPPSTMLIVYGMLAEQSVGALFIAGIVPGIVMALLFVLVIYVWARIRPADGPSGPHFSWKEKIVSGLLIWRAVSIFTVIIGGIYMGVFTPCEAASISVVLCLIFLIAAPGLDWRAKKASFRRTATGTATTIGALFIIIFLALVYRSFLVVSGLPASLLSLVVGLELSGFFVVSLILLLTVILGTIIDVTALAFIMISLFAPLVAEVGFDLVWFGIAFCIAAQMGGLTPPIGIVCFIVRANTPDVSLSTLFKGSMPFLSVYIIMLLILIAFPSLALFLVKLMR